MMKKISPEDIGTLLEYTSARSLADDTAFAISIICDKINEIIDEINRH